MQLAVDLQVHRRADTCSLDEFFTGWPQVDRAPRPYILVVRNVFHELDIDQTAKLLHHVVQHLDQNDLMIVQDIQVFPVSERGHACWLPQNFNALLSSIGFETTFVDEPTAKGNRWFTLIGIRRPEKNLPVDAVRAAVISERKKQYDYWIDLGWLNPDDETFREVRLAKLDFDRFTAAVTKGPGRCNFASDSATAIPDHQDDIRQTLDWLPIQSLDFSHNFVGSYASFSRSGTLSRYS